MRFSSRLVALLIGVSVIGGATYFYTQHQQPPVTKQQQVKTPLTVEQIDKIAEGITVLIDANPPGSGVIIAKEKGWFSNTYYVLTAKHVVKGKNEFDIVTPDKERYRLRSEDYNRMVKELPDVDLAVIKFTSNKDYRVATLTNYSFGNQSIFFDKGKGYVRAFLSGFPDPKQEKEFQEQKYLFTIGLLINQQDSPFSNADEFLSEGYEVAYNNISYRGMSGGAVLDTSGRVIAIHGRNTGEITEGNFRLILGDSLGVPIATFLKLAPQIGMQLPLNIDTSIPTPLVSENIANKYWLQLLTGGCYGYIDCLNFSNKLMRLGDYKYALSAIGASLYDNKNSYLAWYLQGDILTQLGKYEEAIQSYNESIKLNQKFYQVWVAKCSLLNFSLKRHEEALDSCNEAIKINPKSFNNWHQQGQVLREMERHKEAMDAFSKAIAIRPNPHSYLNRAAERKLLGDNRGAIEDYTLAIQINPNYIQGYSNRGITRFAIEDYKGAIKDFSELIRINPNNADAYNYRGNSRRILKSYQDAIADYNEVIRIKPDFADAYLNRGGIRLALKEYQKAIADFNQAIHFAPDNDIAAVAYYNLGLTHFKSEDYQKSIDDFNQTISLKPDFAFAYLRRGFDRFYTKKLLVRKGKPTEFYLDDDYQDVIQDLRKAAQLFHDQKNEEGQKDLSQTIKSMKELLSKAQQDNRAKQVQDELNKIQQSVNTP